MKADELRTENFVKITVEQSKYGNPFQVSCASTLEFRLKQIEKYKKMIEENALMSPNKTDIVRELKGKNLSCWCKVGEPCHADILLEITNQPTKL